jgi:hypothetical protein
MGERHALIITSSKYADVGLPPLPEASHDGDALHSILSSPDIGSYEVSIVADRPYHEIGEAVADFFRDRAHEDVALVYFSTHGIRALDGALHFAATNTRLAALEDTAVSAATVGRAMNRSRCQRILLLLDCCFSGAFGDETLPVMKATSIADTDLARDFEGRGRSVISASTRTQFAYGPQNGDQTSVLSRFTQHLVFGLETGEADVNRDGIVTVTDLFTYLSSAMGRSGSGQTPTLSANGLTGDFVVARSPFEWRVRDGSAFSDELQAAIGSPLPEGREQGIRLIARRMVMGDLSSSEASKLLSPFLSDDSLRVRAAAHDAMRQSGLEDTESDIRATLSAAMTEPQSILMGEVLEELLNELEAVSTDNDRDPQPLEEGAYSFGIQSIDDRTGGIRASDVILVLSDDSDVPPELLTNTVCIRAGVETGMRVTIASFGASRRELARDLVAIAAKVRMSRLFWGNLISGDWTQLARSMGTLVDSPIALVEAWVTDLPSLAEFLASRGEETGLLIVSGLESLIEDGTSTMPHILRDLSALGTRTGSPVLAGLRVDDSIRAQTAALKTATAVVRMVDLTENGVQVHCERGSPPGRFYVNLYRDVSQVGLAEHPLTGPFRTVDRDYDQEPREIVETYDLYNSPSPEKARASLRSLALDDDAIQTLVDMVYGLSEGLDGNVAIPERLRGELRRTLAAAADRIGVQPGIETSEAWARIVKDSW